MARSWYSYVVPNGDPRLSSSYQRLVINSGTPKCFSGTRICAINAPFTGPFPFSPLSPNLLSYIAAALANGIPQPELPAGSRYYVYLKS